MTKNLQKYLTLEKIRYDFENGFFKLWQASGMSNHLNLVMNQVDELVTEEMDKLWETLSE